jgi:hypothetical protein
MKVEASILLSSFLAYTTNAFGVETLSRRDALRHVISGGVVVSVFTVGAPPQALATVTACPSKSQNCIRTAWKVPAGSKDVAGSMLEILNSYPQEGQADVDKGGWTIAEGDLKSSGKTRVEYKSGIGNFARFFNGGKPFVDDLEVEVAGDAIEIRSASRIGESDLGVNQKRLQFLASKARALGWDAPEATY